MAWFRFWVKGNPWYSGIRRVGDVDSPLQEQALRGKRIVIGPAGSAPAAARRSKLSTHREAPFAADSTRVAVARRAVPRRAVNGSGGTDSCSKRSCVAPGRGWELKSAPPTPRDQTWRPRAGPRSRNAAFRDQFLRASR